LSKKAKSNEDDIRIYEQIVKAFDREVKVTECIHDHSPLKIDIVHSKGCPARGKTAFSTIGASDLTVKFPK
jgi:hypothetical protein